MKMSEEMAVRLHRMLWSDMQKELGDNLCSGRAAYKAEWLDKHFPGEHFTHDCFLCEYVMQQTGNRPLLDCAECKICPIKWPGDNCSLREREGGVNYLQSPISYVLALPARNPEIDKPVENSYAEFRERLLSAYSGIPASSAIEDHVMAIKKKAVENKDRQVLSARNGEKSINDRDLMTLAYCNTKTELAKASGLPEEDATTDHIKAIQEKAVEEYFEERPGAKLATMDIDEAFKQYADEQKAPIFKQLSKASGLSENNQSVCIHINWIKNKARQEGRDETKEQMKDLLAKESNLDRNRPIDDHIREIVKNSMEAGATEERDRIQEKIEELLS